MTVVEELACLLGGVRADTLPLSVLPAARKCLLDSLGCGVFGTGLPEGKAAISALSALSPAGKTVVWGTPVFLPVDTAALACGFLCHLRELDDVHYTILHPGAVCVPAAAAVSAFLGLSLGDLLLALVVGYEAMVRIAKGQNYFEHRKRGWHGTATCGAFGAAASVARLLGLDPGRLGWALGLAGSRTGGTWAFAADGAMSKRLHPGLAARDGTVAAYLAQAGITGPLWVLEAEDGGFYPTTSKDWNLSEVTAGWGDEWAVEATEFKWYASCKSAHSSLEAACRIREATDRDVSSIVSVDAIVNSAGYAMAGRGYDPGSVTSAQLSIPYAVAIALLGLSGGVADYLPETVARPDVLELSRKVRVGTSAEFDVLRTTKHKVPAEVLVHWADGSSTREYVEDPKGSRFNPLSEQEVATKFTQLASTTLGQDRSGQLARLVLKGPPDLPVANLVRLLSPANAGDAGAPLSNDCSGG